MQSKRRAVLILTVLGLAACRDKLPEETASPASPPERPETAAERPETAAERPETVAERPAAKGEPAAARPEPRAEEAPPPESGRLQGMSAAHNRAREPLGIAPLAWSPELARYAQRWADKLKQQNCKLRHRPQSGPDAQRYGENIFSATGDPADANTVVDSWVAEVANYDAKNDRCRGVCGHYTQVVWRKSERLGCGMATCGDTEVWVCNYDPPGNFIGQRPY